MAPEDKTFIVVIGILGALAIWQEIVIWRGRKDGPKPGEEPGDSGPDQSDR